MKKINYFKKISLFWDFSRKLRKLKTRLETNFSARIDNAYRIYTVINIPPSLIEEPYNLRKEDIDKLAKTYIRDYSNQLSSYLNTEGLMELYDFYEVKKVEKYSYLVIFGFSLFDSTIFLRNFYITLYSLLLIFAIIFLVIIF